MHLWPGPVAGAVPGDGKADGGVCWNGSVPGACVAEHQDGNPDPPHLLPRQAVLALALHAQGLEGQSRSRLLFVQKSFLKNVKL